MYIECTKRVESDNALLTTDAILNCLFTCRTVYSHVYILLFEPLLVYSINMAPILDT